MRRPSGTSTHGPAASVRAASPSPRSPSRSSARGASRSATRTRGASTSRGKRRASSESAGTKPSDSGRPQHTTTGGAPDAALHVSGARVIAEGIYSYVSGAAVHTALFWLVSVTLWTHVIESAWLDAAAEAVSGWLHPAAGGSDGGDGDAAGDDAERVRTRHRVLFVGGSAIVHNVMYVGVCGFFSACDAYRWLSRYKLPRRRAQQPSAALVRATIVDGMLRHTVLLPLTFWFLIFPAYESECARVWRCV